MQGDSQLVGSIQGEESHSGTPRLGGARDQTSNRPVTSQPALPPEPQVGETLQFKVEKLQSTKITVQGLRIKMSLGSLSLCGSCICLCRDDD